MLIAKFKNMEGLIGQVVQVQLITPPPGLTVNLDLTAWPSIGDLHIGSTNTEIGISFVLKVSFHGRVDPDRQTRPTISKLDSPVLSQILGATSRAPSPVTSISRKLASFLVFHGTPNSRTDSCPSEILPGGVAEAIRPPIASGAISVKYCPTP